MKNGTADADSPRPSETSTSTQKAVEAVRPSSSTGDDIQVISDTKKDITPGPQNILNADKEVGFLNNR